MNSHLHEKKFDVDANISHTLPKELYYEEKFYKFEIQSIFYKSWRYVAHISELQHVGMYVSTSVADQNVFVIKTESQEIKGYWNVCQHRAHELVSGSGTCSGLLVCPYHAWAYTYDGKLHRAPHAKNIVNKECISLKPVRVEIFCGLVFVNLDSYAAPLCEIAPSLSDEISFHIPNIESLKKVESWQEERNANWKLLLENDIECYHCPGAHPHLCSILDIGSYKVQDKGVFSKQTIEEKNSASHEESFLFWYLWPDTEFRIMPGPPNLAIYNLDLLSPTRTRMNYHHFVGPEVSSELASALRHDPKNDPTVAEDVAIVESVQRGLKSQGYSGGSFVINDGEYWTESSVHNFQLMVSDSLGISNFNESTIIHVRIENSDEVRKLVAAEISENHLVIRTPNPIQQGTKLHIAINGNMEGPFREAIVCNVISYENRTSKSSYGVRVRFL